MKAKTHGWLIVLIILCTLLYPRLDAASAPSESDVLEAYLRVFPGARSIGVIYSDSKHEETIQNLEKCAKEKNIGVIKLKIPSIKEFPSATRFMKDNVDTFWVPDDPLYSGNEAWTYFVMFCLRSGKKTVVFTENALTRGGLFYFTEKKEVMINKHILNAFGLKIEEKAGPVKYHEVE